MKLEFDRTRIVFGFAEVVFTVAAALRTTHRQEFVDRHHVFDRCWLALWLADPLLNRRH